MNYWIAKSALLYKAILALSILISVLGIVCAKYSGKNENGGRGGAVATVISLAAITIKRSYDKNILEVAVSNAIKKHAITNIEKSKKSLSFDYDDICAIYKNTQEIIESFDDAKSKINDEKNKYLIISTVISTLFWGFGDFFSRIIMENDRAAITFVINASSDIFIIIIFISLMLKTEKK